MHKNWPALCGLENPWLKMLVITATDSRTLCAVNMGFPELFCNTPSAPRIPISGIREYMAQDPEKRYSIRGTLEHFSVPFFSWGNFDDSISPKVPVEWRTTLASALSRTAKRKDQDKSWDVRYEDTPLYLDWYGQKCLLVEAYDYHKGDGTIEDLILVLPEFIDLDH